MRDFSFMRVMHARGAVHFEMLYRAAMASEQESRNAGIADADADYVLCNPAYIRDTYARNGYLTEDALYRMGLELSHVTDMAYYLQERTLREAGA